MAFTGILKEYQGIVHVISQLKDIKGQENLPFESVKGPKTITDDLMALKRTRKHSWLINLLMRVLLQQFSKRDAMF